MDVLDPELEEIDGCMYRINVVDTCDLGKEAENSPYFECDTYGDNELEEPFSDVANEEENLNITLDNGWYRIKFHVPCAYIPFLVGKRNYTRQRLEKETKTFIRIPMKNEKGDVVIKSRYEKGTVDAYKRIRAMISTARKKQDLTHFISIPTNNAEIQRQFDYFKKTVLEEFGNDRGITEDLFPDPKKLHLTVGVLVLADYVERRIATDALKKCKEMFIDPFHRNRPISGYLKGIECMNDDYSEVNVIYGKVEINDVLQKLMDNVANFFDKEDLLAKKHERENVKMHVTVMNSSYIIAKKNYVGIEVNRLKSDLSFDATNILRKFADFEFGEFIVDRLHLSQRHTSDSDGYFVSTSTVDFY